jgi:hypothetical protein
MQSTCWFTRPAACWKVALNATHMATPMNAMMRTAIAANG